LEKIMADSQAVPDKREEKRHLEKEAATGIYLNLIKEVIKVQKMDVEIKKDIEAKMCDAEARMMDAEAKIRAEDTRISWPT
jgi:hypothetical protein